MRPFELRYSATHIAVWFVLVTVLLWRLKPGHLQTALHWTYRTPAIVYGADDVPRCEDNPVFCRPFSFLAERELWSGLRSPKP